MLVKWRHGNRLILILLLLGIGLVLFLFLASAFGAVTNLTDTFIRLSTTSFDVVWLTLLHILVFSGVSILILVFDRRLHDKGVLFSKN